jgi:hypothetical protein
MAGPIWTSRAPPAIYDRSPIIYYLVPGLGLARQEVKTVTETDSSNDQPELLASEVVELQFRYYDPTSQQWMDSWDGSTSGPPLAVEVTLGIRARPEAGTIVSAANKISHYRAVVSVPTATIPPSSSSGSTTGGSQ